MTDTHPEGGRALTGPAGEEEATPRTGEERSGKNRLQGLQSNDLAEAMALLQSLRAIRLDEPAEVFIDNEGVVITANEKLTDLSRHGKVRMKQGGRAIWNRIAALTQARTEAGATTEFTWVHSHVDDPERAQLKPKCNLTCACGGSAKNRCNPNHPHHKGNEKADALATDALTLPVPSEGQLQAIHGEDEYVMVLNGDTCQGDLGAAIKQASQRHRVALMRTRGSESGMIKQWFEKMDASDPSTRKKVINHQDLSTRFRMRLWTETLPTYKVINTRASEGSADAHIYGTLLEEGKCRCCGSGDIETIDHILTECQNPKLKELRTQAKMEVEKMWAGQGEIRAWSLHDWISPGPAGADHGAGRGDGPNNTNGGHQRWRWQWGYRGLVPRRTPEAVRSELSKGEHGSLIASTAIRLAEYAKEAWDTRNVIALEWEAAQPQIAERKGHLKRTRWAWKNPNPSATRGPARKPDDEVSVAYKRIRASKEKAAELQALHGTQWRRVMIRWNTARREARKKAIIVTSTNTQQITQYPTVTSIRYSQVKSLAKPIKKALAAAAKARATATEDGKCAIWGCDETATTRPMTCRRDEQRCHHHHMLRCIGQQQPCRCNIEKPASATKQQIRTSETPASRKRRYQELTEGSVIALCTDDGWIEGEVTHKELATRRPGETGQQYWFQITPETGEAVHVGKDADDDRLRDCQWWTIQTRASYEDTDDTSTSDEEEDETRSSALEDDLRRRTAKRTAAQAEMTLNTPPQPTHEIDTGNVISNRCRPRAPASPRTRPAKRDSPSTQRTERNDKRRRRRTEDENRMQTQMEAEAMNIVIEDMEVDTPEPNPHEPEVTQTTPAPVPSRAPADKRSGTRKRNATTRQQGHGDETEPAAKRTKLSPQGQHKDTTHTLDTRQSRPRKRDRDTIEAMISSKHPRGGVG